jgi:hypothetical protein
MGIPIVQVFQVSGSPSTSGVRVSGVEASHVHTELQSHRQRERHLPPPHVKSRTEEESGSHQLESEQVHRKQSNHWPGPAERKVLWTWPQKVDLHSIFTCSVDTIKQYSRANCQQLGLAAGHRALQ